MLSSLLLVIQIYHVYRHASLVNFHNSKWQLMYVPGEILLPPSCTVYWWCVFPSSRHRPGSSSSPLSIFFVGASSLVRTVSSYSSYGGNLTNSSISSWSALEMSSRGRTNLWNACRSCWRELELLLVVLVVNGCSSKRFSFSLAFSKKTFVGILLA